MTTDITQPHEATKKTLNFKNPKQDNSTTKVLFCSRYIMLYFLAYRVAQKWHGTVFWYTPSNINRFSKLFHCQNQEKICNSTISKDPIFWAILYLTQLTE